MAGRAGRTNLDVFGESVLIVKESEKAKGMGLMSQALPDLESCLKSGKLGMARPLLEAISSGVVESVEVFLLHFL